MLYDMTVADEFVRIPIQRVRNNRDLPLPSYRSTGASGLDLCAAVENDEFLEPGQLLPVPCGFAIALPPGFEAQIRPEWNLAKKSGVTVLNSPGTIGKVGGLGSDFYDSTILVTLFTFCRNRS